MKPVCAAGDDVKPVKSVDVYFGAKKLKTVVVDDVCAGEQTISVKDLKLRMGLETELKGTTLWVTDCAVPYFDADTFNLSTVDLNDGACAIGFLPSGDFMYHFEAECHIKFPESFDLDDEKLTVTVKSTDMLLSLARRV